jgi:pimeloyl-ACP methyl ester carboxylesterase
VDEASSRFVDQIALEKLLGEKLRKVHHYPEGGLDSGNDGDSADFPALSTGSIPKIFTTQSGFRFESPIPCSHAENALCDVTVHRAQHSRGSVVFLHGLYEDSRAIYDFLFRGLVANGLDVYFSTLPFHYSRRPASSLFNGEFFWSANYKRTRAAFKQAVHDLHALYRIVCAQQKHPVAVCGFSMGGCVALLLAAACNDIDGVVAINPAISLSGIVWDSPLCSTIKADFLAAGYNISQVQRAFAAFEPVSARSIALARERIQLVYGIYDQVTSPDLDKEFARTWALRNVIAYNAGHLNILRVPRLAGDIAHFFQSIANLKLSNSAP